MVISLFQWGNYPDQVQRNSLNLGICIPNSCSALDLQTSLQNKLDAVFAPEEFKTVVRVDPIMCTVKGDMYPHDTPYYLTRSFINIYNIIFYISSLFRYIILFYILISIIHINVINLNLNF